MRRPGVDPDADGPDDRAPDPSGLERRAAQAEAAPVRPETAAARPGLLAAVRALDLTSLSGDDTPDSIRALCARARRPLPPRLLEALELHAEEARVAAVCVHHAFVETARAALDGSGIVVAAVAGGFPFGLSPLEARVAEVRAAVEAGAGEVDVVLRRTHALTGAWDALDDEAARFREACGDVRMKAILGTGELGSLERVGRAARVAMDAGADVLKTSTGMDRVNATFPEGLAVVRAIARRRERTGRPVGFKPAGGIRTAGAALRWLRLVEEELGPEATGPERFRLGASSLLDDLVRALEGGLRGS